MFEVLSQTISSSFFVLDGLFVFLAILTILALPLSKEPTWSKLTGLQRHYIYSVFGMSLILVHLVVIGIFFRLGLALSLQRAEPTFHYTTAKKVFTLVTSQGWVLNPFVYLGDPMWAIILSSLLCGLFVALWFGSFFTLLSLEKDTSIDSTFIPYDWIVGVLGVCLLFATLYMGYQLLHVGIISEQHERDIQSSWAMYGKMAAGGISLLWGFFMLQRTKTKTASKRLN